MKYSRMLSVARIEPLIHIIRGEKVILDADLARLYGVTTKALNQAVKRRQDRFPEDFMFQLSQTEADSLRSQIVTSSSAPAMRSQIVTASKRNVRYLPYAFTDYGILQAANVLNSPKAIAVGNFVVRYFFHMRRQLQTNQAFARRLVEIERILLSHDVTLREVIEKIQPLLTPPPDPPRRKIGFVQEKKARYSIRITAR